MAVYTAITSPSRLTSLLIATMVRRSNEECEALMESSEQKLLLIPLDDTVVFPNMTVTLPLDVGGEARVLLVPRHEGEYASVGTVAEVQELGRLPGGASVATLEGLHRAELGAAETGPDGRLYVSAEERPG